MNTATRQWNLAKARHCDWDGTKSTGHRPFLHYRALRAPPMSPGTVAMLTSGAGPAINPGFHACHDALSLSKLRFCRHQWEGYPYVLSPLDHHEFIPSSSIGLNIHHLGNRDLGEPGTHLRITSEPCRSCYLRRFMGQCGDRQHLFSYLCMRVLSERPDVAPARQISEKKLEKFNNRWKWEMARFLRRYQYIASKSVYTSKRQSSIATRSRTDGARRGIAPIWWWAVATRRLCDGVYCRGRVAEKKPYHYHPISSV
nr:hypothetical protein B11E6.10 [imported] - Neurospora crassa [Neurospora crassa]